MLGKLSNTKKDIVSVLVTIISFVALSLAFASIGIRGSTEILSLTTFLSGMAGGMVAKRFYAPFLGFLGLFLISLLILKDQDISNIKVFSSGAGVLLGSFLAIKFSGHNELSKKSKSKINQIGKSQGDYFKSKIIAAQKDWSDMQIVAPKIEFFPVVVLSSSNENHSYTTTKTVRDITSNIRTADGEGVSIKSFHHKDERQTIRYKNLINQKEGILKLQNESIDVFENQKLCLGVDSEDGHLEMYHNYNTDQSVNMGRSLITEAKEKKLSNSVALEGFIVGAIPLLNVLCALLNPRLLSAQTNSTTEQSCYKGLYKKLFWLWLSVSSLVVLTGYLVIRFGLFSSAQVPLIGLVVCGVFCSIVSSKILRKYINANWNMRKVAEEQLHEYTSEFSAY